MEKTSIIDAELSECEREREGDRDDCKFISFSFPCMSFKILLVMFAKLLLVL